MRGMYQVLQSLIHDKVYLTSLWTTDVAMKSILSPIHIILE